MRHRVIFPALGQASMNFASIILQRALRYPEAVAIVEGEQVITYRDLERGVRLTAAALAGRGVGPGTVVGLASSHVATHLIVTLAIAQLGAISMPRGSGATVAEGLAPLRRAGVKILVGERPLREGEGEALEEFDYIAADGALLQGVAPARPHGWGPDCSDLPWRLSLSSGTTGEPKAVQLTHARTLIHYFGQQHMLPYGPGTRLYMTIGLNISFGVNHCLRQLMFGGTLVAYSPRLNETFSLCERHGVTHMVASPATAARLAELLPDDGPRLPEMHLYMGGAAVSPALRDRLRRRLTTKLTSIYGASELGMLATADAEMLADHPDAAGRIVPWAQAEAADGQGNAVAPGEPGELRFRVLGGCPGYHGDPETTAQFFRDGWFHPGDFGRVTRDGLLFVDGRLNEVINIGGVKLSPLEIEQVLEQHPNVAEAAAFAVGMPSGEQALVAAVVSRGDFDQASLLRHCRERLGQRAPVRVFPLASLPRNDMGKVLRRELAARVRFDPEPGAGAAPANPPKSQPDG